MSIVQILITNKLNVVVESDPDYSSYRFEFDAYQLASSFSMTLSIAVDTKISTWKGIQLIIDNKITFNGIIESRTLNASKDDSTVILTGKNRGKFIVESFFVSFKDFFNKTPKSIIESFIDQTNFYPQDPATVVPVIPTGNWDDITATTIYNTTVKANASANSVFTTRKDQTKFDVAFLALPPKSQYKIEPGDTIFEKMNDLCRSVGMGVMYLDDGTLFFGDINKKRLNDPFPVIYTIIFSKTDIGNNVLSASVTDDESELYSDITVIAQSQNKTTKSATATNSIVEEKKTMVVVINDDEASPQNEAIKIREDQRNASKTISYMVDDHVSIDNKERWVVNRSVNITDTITDTVGQFVLYGVTFMFSIETGKETKLDISLERQEILVI